MSDSNIAAVQGIYEAYGRGDLEAVLASVADDVDWQAIAASSSVPWYGPRHGKEGVVQFFKDIQTAVDVSEFSPLSFASNDNDVIVPVQWTYRVKDTGKEASMTMLHWWRLSDGKVVAFRGAEDTEQSAAAFV